MSFLNQNRLSSTFLIQPVSQTTPPHPTAMRSLALLSLIAGLGSALPQDGCVTVTKQVIVPTRTATYSRAVVVTEHPTTAKNLGVFTFVTTLSDTTTLQTLTSTVGECGSTGVVWVYLYG